MAMRYCGNCGNPIPDEDEYCSVCGCRFGTTSPQAREGPGLPMRSPADNNSRHCYNCGAPLAPDNDFCTECGCRYGEVARQEQIPSQQPKKRRMVLFFILLLVILVVAGGFLWWYFSRNREAESEQIPSSEPSISSELEFSSSVTPSPTPQETSSKVVEQDSSLNEVAAEAIED